MAGFNQLLVFIICNYLNLGIVDVPEHGLSHFTSVPVSAENQWYYFNYDSPLPTTFVYVWIRAECVVQMHLYRVVETERTGRTILNEYRRNVSDEVYYRQKYYRVMVLYPDDCYSIPRCSFVISYQGIANTTDCIMDFRLERGLELTLNQAYYIRSKGNKTTDSAHFEIHNHLYSLAPQEEDLPVLLAVGTDNDYAVTLTHSWGVSSSVYVSFDRGSFRVVIPLTNWKEETMPQLFVWIDIVNGPAYTVRFEPGANAPYPMMWMYVAFGVLTSLFVMSCGFILLGFRHNRVDNEHDDLSIIHDDLSIPPDMATSEDLRHLDLIMWADKRDCKNGECCICLDEFEKGSVVRILPCMHGFHQPCIDTWLLSRQRRCPLCNQDILEAHNFHRRSTSAGRSIELGLLGKTRNPGSGRFDSSSDLSDPDAIELSSEDGISRNSIQLREAAE